MDEIFYALTLLHNDNSNKAPRGSVEVVSETN